MESNGRDQGTTHPEEVPFKVLGKESFELSGDSHKVVTFLNKTLKDSGFIFGLSRPTGSHKLELTVYKVSDQTDQTDQAKTAVRPGTVKTDS